tara:strand:+ start:2122 stop:3330 length:1209 start_codon:yes stop_codon:yes gene_type:complete
VNKLRIVLSSAILLVNAHVCALEGISDRELSEIAGQAFITVDTSSYSDPTYGNFEFSKINLGVDIEIQANTDSVKLGTFDRAYGSEGTAPLIDVEYVDSKRVPTYRDANNDGIVDVNDSDIHLDNLALGRVDDYDSDNPVIVPFRIHNPYIELAYAVDTNNVRRIAGVRIGAESGYGNLSADLISLTGKFDGLVIGNLSDAQKFACDTNATDGQCGVLTLAVAAFGDPIIYSELGLLDGATGDPIPPASDDGALYIKRAQWAGIRNGDYFTTQGASDAVKWAIESLAVSDKCSALGVQTCFNIGIYDSIYVGVDDADSTDDNFEDNGARGVFVSLQSEVVPWEDLSGLPDATRVYAEHGAYLNSAKYMAGDGNERYPLVLELFQGLSGTQRVATCVGRTKGC